MSNYVQTTLFAPKDSLASGNPAKLIVGAQFDTEFGNIATAISSKYDSSSIVGVTIPFGAGSVTAPSITFTGGTNNNTGLYLPAANTLGIAAGGVEVASFAAAQATFIANVVVQAPAAGIAFTASGAANQVAAQITGSSTAGQSKGLQISAGTNASDLSFAVNNQANTINYQLIHGDGSGLLGYNGTNGVLNWTAAGVLTVKVSGTAVLSVNGTAGPTVQGYGPTAAALVDMTPDTGSFTITYTGFTSATTGTAVWARVGNLVTLVLPVATNTSNATTFTATGIPAAINPARAQNIPLFGSNSAENNTTTTNAVAVTVNTNNTLTFGLGAYNTAWTASGTKGILLALVCQYLLN